MFTRIVSFNQITGTCNTLHEGYLRRSGKHFFFVPKDLLQWKTSSFDVGIDLREDNHAAQRFMQILNATEANDIKEYKSARLKTSIKGSNSFLETINGWSLRIPPDVTIIPLVVNFEDEYDNKCKVDVLCFEQSERNTGNHVHDFFYQLDKSLNYPKNITIVI